MKLVLILILATAFSAFAQETESQSSATSEFVTTEPNPTESAQKSFSQALYFPGAGQSQFSVRPELTNEESNFVYKANSDKWTREAQAQITKIGYDYGFKNMNLGLGIGTGFGTRQVETTLDGSTQKFKYSGMEDLAFKIQGLSVIGDTQFIYGSLASFSIGEKKIAYLSRSGTMNSGGDVLAPFVGAEMATFFGSAGGQVSYQLKGERKLIGLDGYEEKITGGNEIALSLFAEKKFAVNTVGATVSYITEQDGVFESTVDGKSDYIAENSWQVQAYGRFEINSSVSLMPGFSFKQNLTKDYDFGSYTQRDVTGYSLAGLVVF